MKKIFVCFVIVFSTNAFAQQAKLTSTPAYTKSTTKVKVETDPSDVLARMLDATKVAESSKDVCKGEECKRSGKLSAVCSYLTGVNGNHDLVCDVSDIKKTKILRYMNKDAEMLLSLMKTSGAVEEEEDTCDTNGKCTVPGSIDVSCKSKPRKMPFPIPLPTKEFHCDVKPFALPPPGAPGVDTTPSPGARDKD